MCLDNDGCCPVLCDTGSDNDCSASCGDGFVDPGEQCDGNCPTSCDDGDACTVDQLAGSPANCTAVCNAIDVTTCIGGDGCCPSNCNAVNDSDCTAVCGNGATEPGETCDGNCPTTCNSQDACMVGTLSGDPNACTAECSFAPITMCINNDGCCAPGCNNNNDNDCGVQCGNGVVEGNETCDGNCPTCNDGNACTTDTQSGSASQCNNVCNNAPITVCVDGDGCCPGGMCNQANDDDCGSVCGNGQVESGELCDGACPMGPADCSPCETFVAGTTTCQNQCQPITGCPLCDAMTCGCDPEDICLNGACAPVSQPDCDAACDGDAHCSAWINKYVCASGNCVECNSNQDCSNVQFCGTNNTCLPAESCEEAKNPNVWCASKVGAGFVCDLNAGRCRQPCNNTSDCGPLQYCEPNSNFCEMATSCGQAKNGNAWCNNTSGGSTDYCYMNECYTSCASACDCNDFNEACVNLTSTVKVCEAIDYSSPPTACTNLCLPGPANTWCQNYPNADYDFCGNMGCQECSGSGPCSVDTGP